MLKKLIEKFNLTENFKIEEAEDGSEIIRKFIKDQFNKNKIKCVITDENMEFIKGSEAIRILKELEKKRKIRPFFFASNTSYENSAIRKKMRDFGFEYFLPKPCSESDVYKLLMECKIIV